MQRRFGVKDDIGLLGYWVAGAICLQLIFLCEPLGGVPATISGFVTIAERKKIYIMQFEELFNDKSLKQKAKTELLSKSLLDKKLSIESLIEFAEKAKDVEKATCIEAIEYATKQNPGIANETCMKFVSDKLAEKAPRVKLESAKVIGNIAHMFPAKLNKAIGNLLINSEDNGTVVRWASAYALGEILKLKTKHNKNLLPTIEAICDREPDNAIKKKYHDAIKKIKRMAS